jgi:hypothetical protein
MPPTQHAAAPLPRHVRALMLILALSVVAAGRGRAQMGPQLSASLAASLLRPAAVDSALGIASASPTRPAAAYPRASYAGRDALGVPRYLQRAFSDEERELLRTQFGIEEPSRLYLSDSLQGASLTYDSDWDRGERDLVSSYRVGASSVRLPAETWEELERRLAATDPATFPRATHRADASLASLDPVVRPAMARLLAAARRAGFRVRVTEARRSAERQAYLLALDSRLTHTATSRHAEGFAVDVVVDDGNLANPVTRRHWIAFRRWVTATQRGAFRLIGTPDRSWDWPHIESVDGPPGFRSIEELLGAARWCRDTGTTDCTTAWRVNLAAEAGGHSEAASID